MENIVYKNLNLNCNSAYLIYIGKIKTWGLNKFLIKPLVDFYKRNVEIIAIMPDFHKYYPMDNVIILNDRSKELSSNNRHVHKYPIKESNFCKLVSNSRFIQELFSNILKNQKIIYVNMYQNEEEFTLDNNKDIFIIGPKKELVKKYNSKTNQYKLAKNHGLPVLDSEIAKNIDELSYIFREKKRYWKEGAYVAGEYGMGGSNSLFAQSESDILNKFSNTPGPFLISELIPNSKSPAVLGVSANKEEVFIASVVDQIMDGPKYKGSVFPSLLDKEVINRLKEYTLQIGSIMGADGYKGIFGCDFIVTPTNQIYFVEINARKVASTLENSLYIKSLLPSFPTIPELEFRAVTQGTFGIDVEKISQKTKGISWGISYVKTLQNKIVVKDIESLPQEEDLFKNLDYLPKERKKRISVMEHVGAGTIVDRGYLGRVVTVAKDHESVLRNLRTGEKMVWDTVKPC